MWSLMDLFIDRAVLKIEYTANEHIPFIILRIGLIVNIW